MVGLQVKRAQLPVRFRAPQWQRMAADAQGFGWRWLVAAVDGDQVTFLDPTRREAGRGVKLTSRAVVENVLAWL